MRLSGKSDWNTLYTESRFKIIADEYKRLYCENTNIKNLLDRFAEKIGDNVGAQNIVELGSAPGGNLVYMHQCYGCEPYGVEYTEEGVQLNQYLFKLFKLPADHVYHLDLFQVEEAGFVEKFDNLISFGVIEHFEEPKKLIENHLKWVKPGGKLLIVIPNLQFIYLSWNKLFNNEIVNIHNLDLIGNDNFFNLATHFTELNIIDQGYFGSFDYGLFTHKNQFFARSVISILYKCKRLYQPLLDKLYMNTKLMSPYQYLIVEKSDVTKD